MPRKVYADLLREMKVQERGFEKWYGKWEDFVTVFDIDGEIGLITAYMSGRMVNSIDEYLNSHDQSDEVDIIVMSDDGGYEIWEERNDRCLFEVTLDVSLPGNQIDPLAGFESECEDEEEAQSAAKDESIRYSSEILEVKAAPTELNLERIVSTVEGVTFYERVLPAPPGGKPFMIMETQVTQALYRAVIGENPSGFNGDQLPMETVSWEDGIAFCNALSKKLELTPAYKGTDNNCELIEEANGFRLPFEAEWEFAAKGGQNFKYAGSDNIDEVAWYTVTSNMEGTRPVGTKKANGYGLYDMSGNVSEWCADDSFNPGQHCPGASKRALRGGGWNNYDGICGVSYSSKRSPVFSSSYLGLRLCRSLG
jgi:formylglycine-generating enzyme